MSTAPYGRACPQSAGYAQSYPQVSHQQRQFPSSVYSGQQSHHYPLPYRSMSDQSNQGNQRSNDQPSSSSSKSSSKQSQFLCLQPPCVKHGVSFARKADLERHTSVTHNRETLKLIDCEVRGCHRRGEYGFTRKDKMVDHMRDVHKLDIPKKQPGSRKNSASPQSGSASILMAREKSTQSTSDDDDEKDDSGDCDSDSE